jgi:hypothetical protein
LLSLAKSEDVTPPGVDLPISYSGLGCMIQDEALVRMAIHKADRLCQLSLSNQNVISEASVCEFGDTNIESSLIEISIWLGLNDLSQAGQFGADCKLVEVSAKITCKERSPTHNGTDFV